jgi:hypothetical protein
VSRDQQRHQFVTHLAVGQALAVLILGEQERGEDVVALREVVSLSAAGDLRVEDLVDRPLARLKSLQRISAPPEAAEREHQHEPTRLRHRRDHRPQPPSELILRRTRLEAEHRPHDHAEGQRLEAREQLEGAADRPAVDLRIGRVAHRLGIRLHPPAVKRREHQPAVAQVLAAVEQQHGTLTQDWAEQRVRLARVELLVGTLEQLLDELRVEQHHEPVVEQGAHVHRAAVAAPRPLEEPCAADHEAGRLDDPRQARAGWQRQALRCRASAVAGGGGL